MAVQGNTANDDVSVFTAHVDWVAIAKTLPVEKKSAVDTSLPDLTGAATATLLANAVTRLLEGKEVEDLE